MQTPIINFFETYFFMKGKGFKGSSSIFKNKFIVNKMPPPTTKDKATIEGSSLKKFPILSETLIKYIHFAIYFTLFLPTFFPLSSIDSLSSKYSFLISFISISFVLPINFSTSHNFFSRDSKLL